VRSVIGASISWRTKVGEAAGETEEEHVVVIKQGGTDPRTGYRERSQVKCLYCLQTGTRRALSHDPDCIHSHVDVKPVAGR